MMYTVFARLAHASAQIEHHEASLEAAEEISRQFLATGAQCACCAPVIKTPDGEKIYPSGTPRW